MASQVAAIGAKHLRVPAECQFVTEQAACVMRAPEGTVVAPRDAWH